MRPDVDEFLIKIAVRGQQRDELLKTLGFDDEDKLKKLRKQEELVFDGFCVIDMYEAAIRHDLKVYQDRKGNWVQKFDVS